MNTWILVALALTIALNFCNVAWAADTAETTKSYWAVETNGETTTTKNWWGDHVANDLPETTTPTPVASNATTSSTTDASVQAAGIAGAGGEVESTTVSDSPNDSTTSAATTNQTEEVANSAVNDFVNSGLVLLLSLLIVDRRI